MVLGSLLSGCALPRMIDSEVESFSSTPPAIIGANYRFERLPSQQAQGDAQDQLERMAQDALSHAGLLRNDTQARYSVQIEVNVVQFQPINRRPPTFDRPFVAANGTVFYLPPMLLMEPAWYSHTVHLVIRDVASANVAFESTASFDGPWSDSANLLPAILEAALHGYPTPPQGLRKVVVELPARGSQEH
jgi:hypothetical protein